MSAISEALTRGIKQVINDASAIAYKENAQLTLDFKTYDFYKLLKTLIRVKGKIAVTIPTAKSSETTVDITYKSDYTYRLLTNFLLKLNSNIEVKQLSDLSYLRYYSIMENIGRMPLENIPTSVTIPANQTETLVDFEFFLPIWFIMPDMINSTQTFIYTELYNTIQAIFDCRNYNSIVASATNDAKLEIYSANIDSVSTYWIQKSNYLESSSQKEALMKMGALFKTNTYQENFTSGGMNLYIRLMPTTQLVLKDLLIVFRDSTGQRVDDVCTRLELRNGDRPLINVAPNIVRQEMIDRYDLDWSMFNAQDDTQKDKQGQLYGVYRIDTSIFGDLENSLDATGNWNQPYLYMDIDQQALEKIGGILKVDVFQSSVKFPEVLQSLANQYVRNTR